MGNTTLAQRILVSAATEVGGTELLEMGFARASANRVVFMADGRIVEDRSPDEFFTNPRSDRAKDFLSKILTH